MTGLPAVLIIVVVLAILIGVAIGRWRRPRGPGALTGQAEAELRVGGSRPFAEDQRPDHQRLLS